MVCCYGVFELELIGLGRCDGYVCMIRFLNTFEWFRRKDIYMYVQREGDIAVDVDLSAVKYPVPIGHVILASFLVYAGDMCLNGADCRYYATSEIRGSAPDATDELRRRFGRSRPLAGTYGLQPTRYPSQSVPYLIAGHASLARLKWFRRDQISYALFEEYISAPDRRSW